MAHPDTVVASIAQHFGRPVSRVESVARRLREADQLPAGGPGTAPDFNKADAIRLLVGACSAATLDHVAEATEALLDATPGGACLDGAPLTIPRTAEVQLAVLAGMAEDGDDLQELTLEIVLDWPELALIWSDGACQRFQKQGTLANHPQGAARWAVQIPGPTFAAFIRSIA